VELGGLRLYFAGDTDHIPEMKTFRCDVALLPISGTYVMTIQEAIEAAKALAPRVVVPMHYGDIVGYEADGGMFAASWSGWTQVYEPER
jgi:L-ascorbate metabolism protein UlaG (beta-lactamase superfamily)